jgi:NADPH-dependent F420 reductase
MNNSDFKLTIAVLGGSGREGKGLAYRFARAGYRVVIGSRFPEKALNTAADLTKLLGAIAAIEGTSNLTASQIADIVVLTVPYPVHREILESVKGTLKGKLLVDVTVPLVPPHVTRVQMPPAGSAAQEAHNILGDEVQVASAFQNISYENLIHDGQVECDVLVTGTSKPARTETLKLVAAIGITGWDAGPLENSAVAEGLTSVLIEINRNYGSKSAGIRIIGVKSPTEESCH